MNIAMGWLELHAEHIKLFKAVSPFPSVITAVMQLYNKSPDRSPKVLIAICVKY